MRSRNVVAGFVAGILIKIPGFAQSIFWKVALPDHFSPSDSVEISLPNNRQKIWWVDDSVMCWDSERRYFWKLPRDLCCFPAGRGTIRIYGKHLPEACDTLGFRLWEISPERWLPPEVHHTPQDPWFFQSGISWHPPSQDTLKPLSDRQLPINRQPPRPPLSEIDRPALWEAQRLRLHGSIEQGTQVGTGQTLSATSGIYLTLEGEPVEGLAIRGVLTDRSIPFQEEGITREIQDFDRSWLEFSYQDMLAGQIGDIEVKQVSPDFPASPFQRKIRGMALQYQTGTSRYHVAGGFLRGRYIRVRIPVQAGNPGPYRIQVPGRSFVSIVAGTERVYLDGKRLYRGWDADYRIDYNTGEITFAPHVPLTPSSEVIIEFQYVETTRPERMGLAGSTHQTRWGRAGWQILSLGVPASDFLQAIQGYGPIRPANGVDSLIEVSAFRKVPVSPARILYRLVDTIVNGIRYDSVFVHVPNPEAWGDSLYEVIFTEVGWGKGDYILVQSTANGRIFQWVAPRNGIPQGNYAPVFRLRAPYQYTWLSGFLEWQDTIQKRWAMTHTLHTTLLFARKNRLFQTQFIRQTLPYIRYEGGMSRTDKNRVRGWKIGGEWQNRGYQAPERMRSIRFLEEHAYLIHPDTGFWRTWFRIHWQESLDLYLEVFGPTFPLHARGMRVSYRWKNQDTLHTFQFWGSTLYGWAPGTGKILAFFPEWKVRFPIFHRKWEFQSTGWFRSFPDGRGFRHKAQVAWQTRLRASGSPSSWSTRLQIWEEWIQRATQTSRILGGMTWQVQSPSWKTPHIRGHIRLETGGVLFPDSFSVGNWRISPHWQSLFRMEDPRQRWHIRWNLTATRTWIPEMVIQFVEVPAGQGTHVWIDQNGDGIPQVPEFFPARFPDESRYIRTYVPSGKYLPAYQIQQEQDIRWSAEHVLKRTVLQGIWLQMQYRSQISGEYSPQEFLISLKRARPSLPRERLSGSLFSPQIQLGWDFPTLPVQILGFQRWTRSDQMTTAGLLTSRQEERGIQADIMLFRGKWSLTPRIKEWIRAREVDLEPHRNLWVSGREGSVTILWTPSPRFQIQVEPRRGRLHFPGNIPAGMQQVRLQLRGGLAHVQGTFEFLYSEIRSQEPIPDPVLIYDATGGMGLGKAWLFSASALILVATHWQITVSGYYRKLQKAPGIITVQILVRYLVGA